VWYGTNHQAAGHQPAHPREPRTALIGSIGCGKSHVRCVLPHRHHETNPIARGPGSSRWARSTSIQGCRPPSEIGAAREWYSSVPTFPHDVALPKRRPAALKLNGFATRRVLDATSNAR